MASSAGGGINHPVTKQEWENMKLFIRRVYIDENKSFPYLANALRIEFGLKPTKRQFSRKIEKWGFRKNVSRSERRSIMKSLETRVAGQTTNLDDRRVNIRKIENWKKRFKKDASTSGFLASFNLTGTSSPMDEIKISQVAHNSYSTVSDLNTFQFGPDPQSPGLPSLTNVHSVWQAPHVIGNINCFPAVEGIGMHGVNVESNSNAADTWPFDWSTVDVHGSLNLLRLFEGLEIECSMPVPAISLDMNALDESEYIDRHGLSQLWTDQNKSLTYKFEIPHHSRSSGLIKEAPNCETGFSPWRNPQLAFCGWNANPCNEIYVFPKNFTNKAHRTPNQDLEWLGTQAIEYELRLDKLEPLCGSQHLGIRSMMKALAKIYRSQGRYKEAERWYRAIVDANRDALGAENSATLDAGLSWIDALVAQGRYLYARTHIVGLRTTILTVFGHESVLNARASFIEARIAGTLGNYVKTEVLTREVLQKRLNDLGPRDSNTWRCIDYLAWVLERQSRFSSAEKLSRISLQLHHEISGLDEKELLSSKRHLSLICSYQGRYDESRDLSRLLQENLEALLGIEHPWVLEAQYAIAVSLRREGKFQESERLYRKVWSQRLKVLGESHPDTWNVASSLAYLLYRMNCFEEAIVWYQKFFWERLEIYGPDGDKTINSCCWLGDCYQKLGRYDDALKLYHQVADKIRAAKGEESPVLVQVQGLINWTLSKFLEEKEEDEESAIVKERRKIRKEKA